LSNDENISSSSSSTQAIEPLTLTPITIQDKEVPFKMLRSTSTVPELWDEYVIGKTKLNILGDPLTGRKSILCMDEESKVSKVNWKKHNSEAKYYSKRSAIWWEIFKRCNAGEKVEDVILTLEQLRLEMKLGLPQFASYIKQLGLNPSETLVNITLF
jgi:hypothetical protein